ncbi:MAG TPA: hypothetical protein VFR64_16955 [Methylomirabilota bacterium]|nr:hypothetical protein [Methylomirabilota bacterium]
MADAVVFELLGGGPRLMDVRDRMRRREPFLLQKAAGDGGDQRRVEGGEASELDVDLVARSWFTSDHG